MTENQAKATDLLVRDPSICHYLLFDEQSRETTEGIPVSALNLVQKIMESAKNGGNNYDLLGCSADLRQHFVSTGQLQTFSERDARLFWARRVIETNWCHELFLFREHDVIALVWSVSRSRIELDLADKDEANILGWLDDSTDDSNDKEWVGSLDFWNKLTSGDNSEYTKSLFAAVRTLELNGAGIPYDEVGEALKKLSVSTSRRGASFQIETAGTGKMLAQGFGGLIESVTNAGFEPIHFDQWLVVCDSDQAEQTFSDLFLQAETNKVPRFVAYFCNTMKGRRLEEIVREQKSILESKRNAIEKELENADLNEAQYKKVQQDLAEFGRKAAAQALKATSIEIANFNTAVLRRELIVPVYENCWGQAARSAVDADKRMLEVANLQAKAAKEYAATLREQLALKIGLLRANHEAKRQKFEKARNDTEKRVEKAFQLLEVFVISLAVVQLTDGLAGVGGEKSLQVGRFDIPWKLIVLMPTGIASALIVFFWASARGDRKTNDGTRFSVLHIIFFLFLIAMLVALLLRNIMT